MKPVYSYPLENTKAHFSIFFIHIEYEKPSRTL